MSGSPESPLLRQVNCPHCWKTFHPEEVLWIAAHADLMGDPRLGAEHQQRILPTRFTVEGNAVDAHGFECQQLACPHCHLTIPRPLLEMEPLFVSILGAPGCGKSWYLAALTWELRKVLPGNFQLKFSDVEPFINQALTTNEEALFMNPRESEYQYLADLIGKTKLQGEMYDTVAYGNQLVSYPRPYLFSFQPKPAHRRYHKAKQVARVLCLYDNAGEHFQPGRDTIAAPVTQHLGRAELLLYLFDPTQDPRFQRLLGKTGPAGASSGRAEHVGSRQDQILVEAAARIRRQLGRSQNTQHDRPLIVILTKSDAWQRLLPDKQQGEPWRGGGGVYGLDAERIERRSREARTLLERICPEVIQAAEELSREVLYVPVSTLGHTPRQDANGPAIRPADIKPVWVSAPVLYGMYRWMRGLVPGLKRSSAPVSS
jgi:hypothetical protein